MTGIWSTVRVLAVTVAALLCHTQAIADTPAPLRDFTKSAGRYIFVMLAPEDPGRYVQHIPEVRNVYKRSGLYRNDDSTTPLWTVDWYAREAFPSSDGEHLVTMGTPAASMDARAVTFYRNGKEIKSYRIKDLVGDESSVKRSVTFLHWKRRHSFQDKHGVLLLTTIDHRTYRFSIRTGEILP